VPAITLAFLLCCSGCRNEERKPPGVLKKFLPPDTTLCELDSARIAAFITKYQVKDSLQPRLNEFYSQRSYKAAWTNNSGVNEYAGNFINLLNNEARHGRDRSVPAIENLQALYVRMLDEESFRCGDSLYSDLEVLLTINFFEYANRNWGGLSDDLSKKAGWFIVRKQMNYSQLLADFLSRGREIAAEEPVYHQYALLKKHLRKYSELERLEKWPALPEKMVPLKVGDLSPQVTAVKKLLRVTGDLEKQDTTALFDSTLTSALASFQSRHGLHADGKLGESTIRALRVPLRDRISQILINMERSRWVPVEVEGSFVVVNIPQFKMHVYENNNLQWSADVIVGKSNNVNSTVVFNDSLELIVFSPYWNITPNIITTEIVPSVKKDKRYLEKNNLEVVDRKGRIVDPSTLDWNKYKEHFPYILRERPGPNNSLGLVKFLFPNDYDIYIHDTPAKALFSKNNRTFSHGCIRLSEPAKFARYLLRDDPRWDSLKIQEAMHGGQEIFVKLRKKVPVFIAYFTAWVDQEGRLNFAEDVYGHDKKMEQLLFVN
jgi:L,D-transpeptidase YcbB